VVSYRRGVRIDPQRLEHADGMMEWAAGEPGAGLRDSVRAYTGYREELAGPVRRRETPAGELTLIVSFGDGFWAQAGPSGDLRPFTSFVAGIADRPTQTAHDGRQLGIQVRLDPLGAFSLLGVPLHELGNRVVELSELLGRDADRWAGRLAQTRGWPERFAVLEYLLGTRMAAGPAPSPQVAWAWRTMRRAGGAVRVADLVAAAGCSHRHLIAGFRDQVGTTPKTAAQVLRYQRSAQLLGRGDLAPATVATVCGYADQSHLTREFARFAGTTPASLRSQEPV